MGIPSEGPTRPNEGRVHKEETILVMYTNADCLRNKLCELKLILQSLSQKPKIIAITEVKDKINDNIIFQEFSIPGYSVYSNKFSENSRGVIIYVENSLESSEVPLASKFKENVIVTVKGSNNLNLTICNVYRSPNSSLDNDFELAVLLNELCNKSLGQLLILGDFNLKDINWEDYSAPNSNLPCQILIDVIRDNHLLQYIKEPTRARGTNTPSILDLVITNKPFVEDVEFLAPLGKSDHVILNIHCSFITGTREIQIKPNYAKGNYDDLRRSCKIDWLTLLNPESNDIESMWNLFKNKILESSNLYIPCVGDFGSWKKSRWKRPINKELRSKIRNKNSAWKRYLRSRNQSDYAQYKKIRNEVRNDTRSLDKSEQNSIANQYKSNPKKFWSFINNKVKGKSKIGDLNYDSNNEETKIASTNEEKVEIFSSFFSSVFVTEEDHVSPDVSHISNLPDMKGFFIDEKVILDKLTKLNVMKSAGPDGIHPRVLFELRNEIAYPLKIIFEQSIKNKQIPLDWRSGDISAIHKKGSKLDAGNYRPISLTCICCKLLESLVRDHIAEFFFNNKLFSNKQYGFIKNRSAVLQLLKVLDDWIDKLENGGQVDVLYTDFEKAFDRVPHRRLLRKLKRYNLDPEIIDWIEAFLTNRRQRVKLNGVFSKWASVLSGIPQGSILGPLLFIIYINDLPESLNSDSSIYLYADDAKLYRYISSIQDRFLLQDDIENLLNWSEKWLIKLNINKCKLVSYGRNVEHNFPYYIKGIEIEELNSIKDLGVTFDANLKFDQHINEKVNKAYSFLGIIKRNFTCLNKEAFIALYKSLVRSHLEYAVQVWSPYTITLIKKLEKVQMRATKLLFCTKDLPYPKRLALLNLPTLHYRRIRGDMIMVYKLVSGIIDFDFASVFTLSALNTRGHRYKLNQEHVHYNLTKYSFTNRVVSIWNSLSEFVVSACSVMVFEKRLDYFWKDQELIFDWKADLTGIGNRA
jgi:hypothetical protein